VAHSRGAGPGGLPEEEAELLPQRAIAVVAPHRLALARALAAGVVAALEVGDMEGARVAVLALGDLTGACGLRAASEDAGGGSRGEARSLIPLDEERRRRGR
jgi:hypothetical protein